MISYFVQTRLRGEAIKTPAAKEIQPLFNGILININLDNVKPWFRRWILLRGLKKPQILLALIIALSIPISSAYLIYCDIAVDDRFDPEVQYEYEELGDFFIVPHSQNQLTFSGSIESTDLLPVFLPEINAIEQVPPFCPLPSCPEQKNLVLRC